MKNSICSGIYQILSYRLRNLTTLYNRINKKLAKKTVVKIYKTKTPNDNILEWNCKKNCCARLRDFDTYRYWFYIDIYFKIIGSAKTPTPVVLFIETEKGEIPLWQN